MKEQQLKAVLRQCEVREQDCLLEKRRIDDVVVERQRSFEKIQHTCQEQRAELESLRLKERSNRVRSGYLGGLSTLLSYENRLKTRIEKLERIQIEKQLELDRALERAEFADQEFVEARVEKKKVERLLENFYTAKRQGDAARSQAITEELYGLRKKNSK